MGVRRYQDLIAWQLADRFRVEVQRVAGSPTAEGLDFRGRAQLLEAARGVPANVVEGFLRYSAADFRRFLDYAIASLGEAEDRLRDGVGPGYWRLEDCQSALRLARRCGQAMLRLKHSQNRYLSQQRSPKR